MGRGVGVPTLRSGWGGGGTYSNGGGGVPTLRSGGGGYLLKSGWWGGRGDLLQGGYLPYGRGGQEGTYPRQGGTYSRRGGQGGVPTQVWIGGGGTYLGTPPPFPPEQYSVDWLRRGRYASCVLAQEDFLVDIYDDLSQKYLCNGRN